MRAIALLGVLLAPPVAGQAPGLEAFVYPAGLIGVARVAVPVRAVMLEGVAGVNLTDRRDFGVHAQEDGWGVGGGVGLRWARQATGWWFGPRVEAWALRIDWRDGSTTGRTQIVVLQPTMRAGWRWRLGAVALDLGAAVGREMNVRTRGEPVGQGWIGLAGVAVAVGR